MLKKSLGLGSAAALIMMFAYGCSSSSTTNNPDTTDSGTTGKDTGAPKADTGVTDNDTGTGDTCAPADEASFSPSWKPPTGKGQKKCSGTQVELLVGCQFDSTADATACKAAAADKSNDDCTACIFTESSATKLGPIVQTGSLGSLNVAGCVALFDGDLTATGCGAKVQASTDCEGESCSACPSDTEADVAALNKCEQKAGTTTCSKQSGDAACANALLGSGGAAEPCNDGNDFLSAGIALGKIFCAGGGTADGGGDAPSDG